MCIVESMVLRWPCWKYCSKRWINWTPLMIVVDWACLSNNDRMNWSNRWEISVVEPSIDETIGRSGVPIYLLWLKYKTESIHIDLEWCTNMITLWDLGKKYMWGNFTCSQWSIIFLYYHARICFFERRSLSRCVTLSRISFNGISSNNFM